MADAISHSKLFTGNLKEGQCFRYISFCRIEKACSNRYGGLGYKEVRTLRLSLRVNYPSSLLSNETNPIRLLFKGEM